MERSEYTISTVRRTRSYHPSGLPGVEQDPVVVLVGLPDHGIIGSASLGENSSHRCSCITCSLAHSPPRAVDGDHIVTIAVLGHDCTTRSAPSSSTSTFVLPSLAPPTQL
jgi:hypothetical protein